MMGTMECLKVNKTSDKIINFIINPMKNLKGSDPSRGKNKKRLALTIAIS